VTRTKPSIAAITGDGNIVGDGSIAQVVKVERDTSIEITQVAGDYYHVSSVSVPAVAPAPPARFVGRQTDLDALREALMAGNVPQAITGMGGIGKTALAQQLALRMADDFPGGVFWADLPANEGRPMPILEAWACLCGQNINTLPTDLHACATAVRGFLAKHANEQGRLLIVIDDVREKWIDGARALNESRPPYVPLLLTTRDSVSATNLGASVYPLDVLSLADAVTLLSQLAGDVVEREQEYARKLATLVGCLPLALELAGKLAALRARRPGWRLAALCERVEGGRADENLRVGEQPGLAATFSVSYKALNADQRRLFRALGAFAPVPMAAEGVTIALGGDLKTAKATEDGLDNLVDLSLVRWWKGTGVASTYYTMHPLMYEFAAGLTSEKERKGFRTPVLHALREVMRSERRLEVERRNAASMLTRLRWLDDTQGIASEEMSICLELVGRYLDSPADRRYLVQHITSVLESDAVRLSELQRVQLLVYRAVYRGYLGELSEAAKDYRKARRLIGTRTDPPEYQQMSARVNLGFGNILRHRAGLLSERADQVRRQKWLQKAGCFHCRAVELAQAYGRDVILQVNAYKELSLTCAFLQDWDKAEECYNSALRVLKANKDRIDPAAYTRCYAEVLERASHVRYEKGDHLVSLNKHSQALAEYKICHTLAQDEIAVLKESSGESEGLVIAYLNSGDSLWRMSKCSDDDVPLLRDQALEDWQTALDMARRLSLSDLEREAIEILNEHASAQPVAPGEPAVRRKPEPLPLDQEVEDRPSIRRLLAEARENLRLIQERQAQYVLSTDIPLQLVKEERRLLDRIAELEQQLAEPTVPGGPGPCRDGAAHP